MRLSVLTPSYQNSHWLKLCIASVADQGCATEHIVQDAVSTDGTLEWLSQDRRVKTFVEKDQGMYDAVNRGLKKSSGEICAYLNCDEQYLPDALSTVERYFAQNPEIEMVFGDAIVINSQGEFLCHRKALLPLKPHSLVSENLSILTCATFFRRSLFEQRGLFFNSQMRLLGDAEWLVRCIEQKVRMALLKTFTSVFTVTGENMSFNSNPEEREQLLATAPWWLKKSKSLVVTHHRIRKFLANAYSKKPFQYQIYTQGSPATRIAFDVRSSTGRWSGGF